MKKLKNTKRFAFAVISNAFLLCNLTKAAAVFDPLKGYVPIKSLHILCGESPCVWPDPGPTGAPGDPTNPGSPDCIIPDGTVCRSPK